MIKLGRMLCDIWYGNVVPIDQCGKRDESIAQIELLMEKNKSILLHALSETQKETFAKYVDCVEEYVMLVTEQAFCEGAQFSGKFLAETIT